MSHLSEEELVLYYYGETGDAGPVRNHLAECESCRGVLASLQRVLNMVDTMPVPERGPEYAERVWQQISGRLGVRRRFRFLTGSWRWAAAATAMAGLLIAAFLAGRSSQPTHVAPAPIAAIDPQLQQRILDLAVGDYLDRSQIVLTELANANPEKALDISSEQQRAADLLTENRLYRQTAAHTGNEMMAGVLDELERVLLEISHAPSRLEPGQVEEFHRRLRAEGVLFRIRVLGSTVRNQEPHKL
jgi:hypothetical protein